MWVQISPKPDRPAPRGQPEADTGREGGPNSLVSPPLRSGFCGEINEHGRVFIMMRMSACPMVDVQPRDALLIAMSRILRFYPVLLRASQVLQRFVQ